MTWGLAPTPPDHQHQDAERRLRKHQLSGTGASFLGPDHGSCRDLFLVLLGNPDADQLCLLHIGNCQTITAANLNATQVPFSVTAQVSGGCTVTATDIDFGFQSSLTANIDQTNTISVAARPACPMSSASTAACRTQTSPATRLLSNGIDDITYGIYSNSARTSPWGSTTGVNTVSAPVQAASRTSSPTREYRRKQLPGRCL